MNIFLLAFVLDLDPFPPEERPEVRVKEGKGMVLLCDPPYHFPGKFKFLCDYMHLFNEWLHFNFLNNNGTFMMK